MDDIKDNSEINEELQVLETFDETSVEPINHTRNSLADDYTLSYL